MNFQIYQIYYDDDSKKLINSNFIPLNNENGPKDWFELYPIFQTLKSMNLKEDTWYGFLSPRVFEKIDISADHILDTLQKHNECDVALFSSSWASLAMFDNVWDQGDFKHPGLFKEFNNFLQYSNRKPIRRNLLNDFSSSVFSNYVVAKKELWQEWLLLAEDYFNYEEHSNLHKTTFYRNKELPLKVFIQERFPSYILNQSSFKVMHADYSQWDHQLGLAIGYPISTKLFIAIKSSLLRCNQHKKNYIQLRKSLYLVGYLFEKNVVRALWSFASIMKNFFKK